MRGFTISVSLWEVSLYQSSFQRRTMTRRTIRTMGVQHEQIHRQRGIHYQILLLILPMGLCRLDSSTWKLSIWVAIDSFNLRNPLLTRGMPLYFFHQRDPAQLVKFLEVWFLLFTTLNERLSWKKPSANLLAAMSSTFVGWNLKHFGLRITIFRRGTSRFCRSNFRYRWLNHMFGWLNSRSEVFWVQFTIFVASLPIVAAWTSPFFGAKKPKSLIVRPETCRMLRSWQWWTWSPVSSWSLLWALRERSKEMDWWGSHMTIWYDVG